MMQQPCRTLVLTERVPQIERLDPIDAEYLATHHRERLRLRPARGRDRYELLATGIVGVIVAPCCRLSIRPKIPLRSLFHLLAVDQPVLMQADEQQPAGSQPVFDFLAAQLAQLLHAATRNGLAQQYHERSTQGSHLQGRLDVAAQMQQGPLHRHSIHSLLDERTVNVPLNQTIRAVAETLLAHADLSTEAQQMLRESLGGWQGVTPLGPDLDLLNRAAHTASERDRSLLGLCLLLLQSQTPSFAAGDTLSPGYLLDMERVFERYLTTGLEQQFTGWGWDAQRQPSLPLSIPNLRQPDIVIRPDLLVLRQEQPILVVDAKWKRLKNHQPRTEDLYQVLAYCLALDCRCAALVYPGQKSWCQEITLPQTGTLVQVHTLDVSRSGATCRGEMRRLGKQLRTLAEGQP